MCMICGDFKAMTTEQTISNLYNIMNFVGRPHALKIAGKITKRMFDDGSIKTVDKKHEDMYLAIAKFVM